MQLQAEWSAVFKQLSHSDERRFYRLGWSGVLGAPLRMKDSYVQRATHYLKMLPEFPINDNPRNYKRLGGAVQRSAWHAYEKATTPH